MMMPNFRVLISAYLFLTGYGHFVHFWSRGKTTGMTTVVSLVLVVVTVSSVAPRFSAVQVLPGKL